MHLGQWLRQARADAGLSYAETTYRIRAELPEPMWVSLETIRRVEKRERDIDPVLVVALARVYGKSVSDLPEEVGGQVKQVRDLLIGTSA